MGKRRKHNTQGNLSIGVTIDLTAGIARLFTSEQSKQDSAYSAVHKSDSSTYKNGERPIK